MLTGTTVITLVAHDKDAESRNNQFDMKIVSVTPETQNLMFYLEQRGDIGTIAFKGCLDHEVRGLDRTKLKMLKSIYLHYDTKFVFIYLFNFVTNQTAEKYTIIVEAKDRGEKIQLSSSSTVILNIEDGNNYYPEMLEKTVSHNFLKFPPVLRH